MNEELKKLKFGTHGEPELDVKRERVLKGISDSLDTWDAIHRLIDQRARIGQPKLIGQPPRWVRGRVKSNA